MQISTNDWKNYIDRLAKLNQKAASEMQKYVAANGFADTDALIDFCYALVTKYGEGSAELACQMYDAMAEMANAAVDAAVPAATATYAETARAVQGSLLQSPTGQKLPQIADRLVKQAAADTTLQNAIRDHAQWAWVPSGDTCGFCITLASNGWQRASKRVLRGNHATHIHANCDCMFAIRFSENDNVKGYDPDYYKKLYDEAPGGSSSEKVKALRRQLEDRDKINAQKREAYAQARQIVVDKNKTAQLQRFTKINADFVPSSKHGVYLSENARLKEQGLQNIEKSIDAAYEVVGDVNYTKPTIYILSQDELGKDTFAAYNCVKNEMYLSDTIGNKTETRRMQKALGFANPHDPTSTTKHEFLHWADAGEYVAKNGEISENNFKSYLQYRDNESKIILDKKNIGRKEAYKISKYAGDSYDNKEYTEVYTEFRIEK